MRAVLPKLFGLCLTLGVVVVGGWIALQFWLPVRVAGGSMRPALSPGDLVIVNRKAHAHTGQIVLFDSARHGRVLHRVVAVRGDGSISTRGDANAIVDFDSLQATAVVGPMAGVVPVGRLIERWRGSAACATMTAQ